MCILQFEQLWTDLELGDHCQSVFFLLIMEIHGTSLHCDWTQGFVSPD